jgi:hypothetical protein
MLSSNPAPQLENPTGARGRAVPLNSQTSQVRLMIPSRTVAIMPMS